MLNNCLRGMKRKAHGAQEPRHIKEYVEVASAAQRSDSPAQAINQRFLKTCLTNNQYYTIKTSQTAKALRTKVQSAFFMF
jgi:hypothetical protein